MAPLPGLFASAFGTFPIPDRRRPAKPYAKFFVHGGQKKYKFESKKGPRLRAAGRPHFRDPRSHPYAANFIKKTKALASFWARWATPKTGPVAPKTGRI